MFPLIVCQENKSDRNTVTNMAKLRDLTKDLIYSDKMITGKSSLQNIRCIDLYWESRYKCCPILYWEVSFICLFRIKFIYQPLNFNNLNEVIVTVLLEFVTNLGTRKHRVGGI